MDNELVKEGWVYFRVLDPLHWHASIRCAKIFTPCDVPAYTITAYNACLHFLALYSSLQLLQVQLPIFSINRWAYIRASLAWSNVVGILLWQSATYLYGPMAAGALGVLMIRRITALPIAPDAIVVSDRHRPRTTWHFFSRRAASLEF